MIKQLSYMKVVEYLEDKINDSWILLIAVAIESIMRLFRYLDREFFDQLSFCQLRDRGSLAGS